MARKEPPQPPLDDLPPEDPAALAEAQARDGAERLDNLENQLGNVMDSLDGLAKNFDILVRQFTRAYEPAEMEIGGAGVAHFRGDDIPVDRNPHGPELVSIETSTRTDVDSPAFAEKARELAFLKQRVRIRVMKPMWEGAPPFIDVSVNGENYRFGGIENNAWDRDHIVPRYIVLQLLQCRFSKYESQDYVSPKGVKGVRYPRQVAQKLELTVIDDPAGQMGMDWARRERARAA